MQAGDGLIVRVRPRLGRLDRAQVLGLCAAAGALGNGLIDLTSRANLQIRGVNEDAWPLLIERLLALDLIDADPALEARRTILVAPDWHDGDDSVRIAEALTARLADLPELPGKVGFAIDAGPAPILRACSADFRIERGESGGLVLRADGRESGLPVAVEDAADALIALAQWFADSGGGEARRMARHDLPLPPALAGTELPAPSRAAIAPGAHVLGRACGLPFGQIAAAVLAAAMTDHALTAIRLTPWRVLIAEGAPARAIPGFVDDAADPRMRVDACPGAPICPQASVETRALASRLVPLIGGRLHISGCAKGCARAAPADVTLTGREGRFDLALAARAGDPPLRAGLTPSQIFAHFGAV